MPFQPRRRWEGYSDDVQHLRWALVAWLEALTDRAVTVYPGSASVKYPPNAWSKYKLLPFDEDEYSPIRGHGEGLLVGLDSAECARLLDRPIERALPDVTWCPEPMTIQVGSGARTYRFAVLATDPAWEQRRMQLRKLAGVVRRLENVPVQA